MRLAGSRSWEIHLDPWPMSLCLALWVRAAERIDVPAGGIVPGPARIHPPPTSTVGVDSAELASGWLAWWQAVAQAPRPTPPADLQAFRTNPPVEVVFGPPDFAGLAPWPGLQAIARQRWPEANTWHAARKQAGLHAGQHRHGVEGRVVHDLERALGRKARPFTLELLILPVQDEHPRQARPGCYLIPEPVYDSPAWPRLLTDLLHPIA